MARHEGEGRLPRTGGRSRPPQPLPWLGGCLSYRSWALSPHHPVHWSQSGPGAFASPPHWCRGAEDAAPWFPPCPLQAGVLLCRGSGQSHRGAPWVLQVPPHSPDQQLLQPAGRLGHAGRAGEWRQAGGRTAAVPVVLRGAAGARKTPLAARTFSLLSARRVWRALGNATGPTAPSCARGCATWGLSSL